MKRSKKPREPFSLKQAFGFRQKQVNLSVFQQPMLHINCKGEIEVENSRKIVEYTPQEICLAMGDLKVKIEGDCLIVDTYQKNRMSIHGTVFGVRFYFEGAEHA